MPGFYQFFQGTIKSCNFFTSPVNFRYKLEKDYNTFAGGIISIILILLLMSVFFNSWMSLLNKNDITSATERIRQFDPTNLQINSDQFMFAIGVNGINLTENSQKKYFDLTMTKVQMIKGQKMAVIQTPFTLEPCKMDHWEHLGEEFVQTYKRQGLNSYLCPPRNTTIEVIGKWTSQKFTFFKISFDKCKGTNCRTKAQIDEWISKYTSFFFNFFYSNTLLNPDQTQPISMFLQDKDFTMFSQSLSTFTNVYLGQYVMKTDESIFPWIQEKVNSGFFVNRAEKETLSFVPAPHDAYCQLFLRKSNIKIEIERKFRKLDDILSYIGGLFGIITFAMGVVVNYYGQCSFELQMCQKIFDYHHKKQDQEEIKVAQTANDFVGNLNTHENNMNKISTQKVIEPKEFGFFDFFLHILVYVPLKKICNIKWRKMQVYEESLEEMRHKLDISQLMEKLNFYDRSINALFDENQLKLLYLQDKFNFQEVRDERKMFGLREDIKANCFESKETHFQEPSEIFSIREHKKSLKEIAQMKTKKLQSFMGGEMIARLNESLARNNDWINEQEVNGENFKISYEIRKALKLLDEKIYGGDVISTRIYNGLQYELLQAYEKCKSGEHRYTYIPVSIQNCQLRKKNAMKSKKILVRGKVIQDGNKLKNWNETQDQQDYSSDPSETSINQLQNQSPYYS